MKRKPICLVALSALTAASFAIAADDPELRPAAVGGKTIVVERGSGAFGGGFQRDRSVRLNLQPATRKLEKASYVGLMVTPVMPELRSQLKLQPGVGLVVQGVTKDSPATAAGVEQYDVLQQLNDQLLIDPNQFAVLVRLAKPGEEFALKVVRKGEPLTLKVKPVEKDLPPLDVTSALREDSVSIERSADSLSRALELMRTPEATAGTIRFSEDGRTLVFTQQNGNRHLTAKDAEGKTFFDGPINTAEQRKALPPELAERLKEIEGVARRPTTLKGEE